MTLALSTRRIDGAARRDLVYTPVFDLIRRCRDIGQLDAALDFLREKNDVNVSQRTLYWAN